MKKKPSKAIAEHKSQTSEKQIMKHNDESH